MEIAGFTSPIEIKILSKAKKQKKTIVLPEAFGNEEVVKAGLFCAENKIAKIVLLVKDDNLISKVAQNEYLKIVNIKNSDLTPLLSSALFVKRKDKGLTQAMANELIKEPSYFATMMVEIGLCDGMVNGSIYTSADSIRPALQIIKGKENGALISSFFVMISENKKIGENGVLVIADCGLNLNPNSEEIKSICIDTVNSAIKVGGIKNPKVALLSYSTLGSAEGDSAVKMREATKLIKKTNPNFIVDGEFQFDAAVNKKIAEKKAPNSKIKGDANILIFPDLQSGNIAYKIMQRYANFKVIGPICQGFKKPVNDLSRGADYKEIVRAIAITVLQCD